MLRLMHLNESDVRQLIIILNTLPAVFYMWKFDHLCQHPHYLNKDLHSWSKKKASMLNICKCNILLKASPISIFICLLISSFWVMNYNSLWPIKFFLVLENKGFMQWLKIIFCTVCNDRTLQIWGFFPYL